MKRYPYLLILCVILFGFTTANDENEIYESETLIINKISEHVYEHITYLDFKGQKVPCNGMILIDKNEAVIFDTTIDDETSLELINQIKNTLKCKITAIIPTHYHKDNLGGLNEFHKQGISSFAYQETIEIAKKNGYPQPQNGFEDFLELNLGDKKVYAEFLGEGHTCDNVIGYFPSENIMFGGCLIKELGAGKGNLTEANTTAWSETVKKVMQKYPETKIIIPGHGKAGGTELFDYTIKLFELVEN